MTVLVLDSCGPLVSVALQHHGHIYDVSLNVGFHHTENIMRACDLLITQTGINKNEIDLICCPKGPGSFTGLRIALASAKGLSIALEKPLISIDTLEAYAHATAFMPSLVLLDARKNRFYGAFFNKGQRCSKNFDLGAEEISHWPFDHDSIMVTGPGARLFMEQVSGSQWILDPQYMAGKASFFIPLAEKNFNIYGADDANLGADYLRLSDAEEFLMNKKH